MNATYSLVAIVAWFGASRAVWSSTAKPASRRNRPAGLVLAGAAIAFLAGASDAGAANPPAGGVSPNLNSSAPSRQASMPQAIGVGPSMTVTPAAMASGGLYMSLTGAANVGTSPQTNFIYLLPTGSVSLEFTATVGRAYRIDCSVPQYNPLAWRAKLNGQPFGGQAQVDIFSGHLIFSTPKAPTAGQAYVEIIQPTGVGEYTLVTSCTVSGVAG